MNAVDYEGETPLMYAVESFGYFGEEIVGKLIRMFIEKGADLYLKNKKGETFFDIFKNKYNEARRVYKYDRDGELDIYILVHHLLERADAYYKGFDNMKKGLLIEVYDDIQSFAKEISMIVADYAVITIKEFLSEQKID